MLSTLIVHNGGRNPGPLDDLTLTISPAGTTTLAGQSGSGKSTVKRLCIALVTGVPGDLPPMRPDAEVRGITGGGTELTILPDGKGGIKRRTLRKRGAEKPTAYTSAEEYAAALAPVARDPELVRAIMDPDAWQDLLRADLGRPLRALLMRVLPGTDDVASIMRATVPDITDLDLRAEDGTKRVPETDPEYGAALIDTLARKATAANAARDRAVTLSEAAAKLVTRTEADAPPVPATEEELIAARVVLGIAAEWTAYDRAAATFATDTATREAQVKARDEWRARDREIGKRPELDSGDLMVANRAVSEAQAALVAAEKAERDAEEAARLTAAVARATAEAEERGRQQAAREAEEARHVEPEAAPVSPPPVTPVKRPAPKVPPQPTAPLFVPPVAAENRCPTCKQIVPATPGDDLPF